MKREELWCEIIRRNPTIEGECTFKPGQVQKLFNLVWDQSALETRRENRLPNVPDYLSGLFGRGKFPT